MRNSNPQVNISRNLSIVAVGLALLIAALLLWRTAQSVGFSAGIFGYPFQVDESEGMIAAETMLLDQGQNIYNFPAPQQFVAAPYPPLYYLLNLPFIHFTGYSLKVGRTLTILSSLTAAALIFALINLTTRRRLAALIATLAFLANSLIAFWGAIVKPDVLAMSFALLGLYCVARYIPSYQGEQRFAPTYEGDNARQQGGPPPAPTNMAQAGSINSKLKTQNSNLVYLAAIAFALAMLTKQTSVAGAGAGFIVLLWADWRRGLKAIALYLAIVGGVSLLLDWQTAGGYYWHMITVHALPWSFERVVSYVQTVWAVNWPLIIMGAAGLLVGLATAAKSLAPANQRNRFSGEADSDTQHSALSTQHSALKVMLFLYALAAVVQASGVGTLGGVSNHFLDAFSALCIGFGLLIGWLLDWVEDSRAALTLRVGGLVGIGVVAVLVWVLVNAEYDPHDLQAYQFRLPSASQLDGMSHIAQFATNNGGLIYSDNVTLALSAHQRPRSTDPYTQTHASSPSIHPNPADRWDESQIVADIRAKKFALIILADSNPCKSGGGGVESPAIALAVCDSYQLIQRNVEYVYQPGKLSAETR